MELKNRLTFFIEENFDSYCHFTQIAKIEPAQLSRYKNGKTCPSAEILSKLYKTGLNINWLLSGEGTMFANNNSGQKLEKEYFQCLTNNNEFVLQEKIKKWIKINYGSLNDFSREFNYDFCHVFENGHKTSELLNILKSSGYNIDWLFKYTNRN